MDFILPERFIYIFSVQVLNQRNSMLAYIIIYASYVMLVRYVTEEIASIMLVYI